MGDEKVTVTIKVDADLLAKVTEYSGSVVKTKI